jgi:hypothetical protein
MEHAEEEKIYASQFILTVYLRLGIRHKEKKNKQGLV